MTDNVRQAVFQAGIKDAAIRDHLALHAGRLNSFDKMSTEVSTVARTRNENDVVPMDVSVLKGKGGKGKDGKGKDGKNKEGKEKTKAKDDKDKSDPKSNSNKDNMCFYCERVGHIRADCLEEKRDDEERKTMSAQNGLTSSNASTNPPRLTNGTTNISGVNTSSLRQLTITSYVLDDEFHSPMKLTMPVRQIMRMSTKFARFNVRFNFKPPVENSSSISVRNLFRFWPKFTYQVTDVEGLVAAVSSMNDSGMTVVFSPVEQVEQIAGNPAIEEKRQEMSPSADPVVKDNEDTPVARARKPPPGPTAEELDKHELTHVVFRSWCKHCIFPPGQRRSTSSHCYT